MLLHDQAQLLQRPGESLSRPTARRDFRRGNWQFAAFLTAAGVNKAAVFSFSEVEKGAVLIGG